MLQTILRKIIKIPGLVIFSILLLLIISVTFNCNADNKGKWRLVWTDNFNSKKLNNDVWGYMERGKDDSRRYHSSNPACCEFKRGKLILKGIKNPVQGKDTAKNLTGGITTRNRKAFIPPFRIEIRAKLNCAKGAWPAFWMMPFKTINGWPADGEIDIMEHLNFDKFVYQTVHSSYTKANRNAYPQRTVKAAIKINKFNTYRVDILPDCVIYYVNGVETLRYPKVAGLEDQGQFPFFHDWYLMLCMQLGGSWVGPLDPEQLPVEMEIDWVKYYQLK